MPQADLLAAIHAERAALADDLAGLSDAQWAQPSLCDRWTVEEVVAHVTAGASVRFPRWLLSMLAARFDDGVHNDRRLAEHRGEGPLVSGPTLALVVAMAGRAPACDDLDGDGVATLRSRLPAAAT